MNNKGVTLPELIIVIVVISIISTITTISVSEILSNTKKEAFLQVGDTMIEAGRSSYYQEDSIWNDDKATVQELLDNEYFTLGETDPWSGTYDNDLSYVVKEGESSSDVFKLKIVTSVAILGKDADLETFAKDDIYFIDASSGSVLDEIKTFFDNDLEEDATLDDEDNLFTVQDNIKSGAVVSTLGGADTVLVGGNVTGSSKVDTGDGNDKVTITGHLNDNSTLSTGVGDDIVDVKNKLNQGAKLTTGAGNDKVTIYKSFTNASVDTGAGDDVLISGSMLSGANVNTGSGNDKFTVHAVSNSFGGSTITLGAGDDRLNIYDTMTGTSSIWDGGTGYDTLHLPEVSIAEWNAGISSVFKGFEKVILSDGELDY